MNRVLRDGVSPAAAAAGFAGYIVATAAGAPHPGATGSTACAGVPWFWKGGVCWSRDPNVAFVLFDLAAAQSVIANMRAQYPSVGFGLASARTGAPL